MHGHLNVKFSIRIFISKNTLRTLVCGLLIASILLPCYQHVMCSVSLTTSRLSTDSVRIWVARFHSWQPLTNEILAASPLSCPPHLNKIRLINAILMCTMLLCFKCKDPRQSQSVAGRLSIAFDSDNYKNWRVISQLLFKPFFHKLLH